MTQPIPVLIVIDHLHTGGAQEFLVQLCQKLPKQFVRPTVCALRGGGIYVEHIDRLGIPLITLAPSGHPAWRVFAALRLRALLRSERYHIIHTFLEGSFGVGTPFGWATGLPTIHTIVATRQQWPVWYRYLLQMYQPLVNTYCTFSPSDLTTCGITPEKIKAVDVRVDMSAFLGLHRDNTLAIEGLPLHEHHLAILSVGRLHPEKGHEYAIKAWPQVVQKVPQARLVIVGDGDDEARLRRMANETGVQDTILFTGFRKDLEALYSRAAIFLRTSINEGINLSTTYALAAALPAIGFSTQTSKEIIVNEENGLLIPLRDHHALAEAITRLAQDKALRYRMGEAGRSAIRLHYGLQPIIDFYTTLYQTTAVKPLAQTSVVEGAAC